jgi:hypothetical protein
VTYDCDDPAMIDRVLAECGDTTDRVWTPSGGQHLTYRLRMNAVLTNAVDVRGLEIDIRKAGGLRLIPKSRTEKGEYRWVEGCELRPASELRLGNYGWTKPRKKRPVARRMDDLPPGQGNILNPERYCLSIASVEGSNGSAGLWRVVSIMFEAGRTYEQAFDYVFNVWNRACAEPLWSEPEVRHAMNRRYGRT